MIFPPRSFVILNYNTPCPAQCQIAKGVFIKSYKKADMLYIEAQGETTSISPFYLRYADK